LSQIAPVIEVIVPTYNMEPYIAQTLDSILSQAIALRVHVVDDGSSDRTAQIVAPYLKSGRVTYHNPGHSGCAGIAKNYLVGALQAPFVAFFDADDVMLPDYLARHVALLQRHPEWVGVTADYQNFSKAQAYPQTHFATCPMLCAALVKSTGLAQEGLASAVTFDALTAKHLLVRENFSITGSLILRTPCVQKVGGFDASLRGSEDFDLLWRVLAHGPLGVSRATAFQRRIHAANSTNNVVKMLRYKIISRRKLRELESDKSIRGELSQAIASFSDALAYEQLHRNFTRGLGAFAQAMRDGAAAGRLPRMALKALMQPLRGPLTGVKS
jgi:glycosyltransferase involved in cell wall biosynthesis